MGIRLPLQTVLDYKEVNGNTPGASSTAGGTAVNFYVPQDSDGLIVKVMASTTGGGYSALIQTTDDGGTTWYDVARTSIVSNTGLPAGGLQNAEIMPISVIAPSGGMNRVVTSLIAPGSIVGVSGTSGFRAAASTLAAGTASGIPIMGTLNRLFLISTGTITATSLIQVQIKVNSQTPNA